MWIPSAPASAKSWAWPGTKMMDGVLTALAAKVDEQADQLIESLREQIAIPSVEAPAAVGAQCGPCAGARAGPGREDGLSCAEP